MILIDLKYKIYGSRVLSQKKINLNETLRLSVATLALNFEGEYARQHLFGKPKGQWKPLS